MSHRLNFDDDNFISESDRQVTARFGSRDGAPLREDEPELRLAGLVRAVYKRRWLAVTIAIIAVGLSAVYAFTAVPIYGSTTRLLIESNEQNVVAFDEVVEENQGASDYYQTQHNILQSRSLVRRMLDKQKLWDQFYASADSASRPSGILASLRQLPTLIDWRGRRPSSGAAATLADETAQQSAVIDSVLEGLSITPIRQSRLVDVSFESRDASLAAQVANGMAQAYIEQNLEYRFLASNEATAWLGDRVAEQRQQVEAAEAALQRYREQNDAISLEDTENIVVQKLADLNAAVTRAKTVRIEKEALYNQLRHGQSNQVVLDTFPAILSNAFIQQQKAALADLQRQQAQLSENLGPKHPDLIKLGAALQLAQAKLDAEVSKVVESVRSEFLAAAAQESSLTAALNSQKSEAQAMNRKAIDYNVLARDVESSKQMYESLLQRAKETGVAGALRTTNIRVVDAAERPRAPIRPKKGTAVVSGGFAGVALALVLVLLFEFLDSRLKTPDDVKVHLGLSTLGMLPLLDIENPSDLSPLAGDLSSPQFAEALKTLRTSLLFSTTEKGSKAILVTSAGPGEGKSTVASHIAASLADVGQRTLLVDADMRRPKIHVILGLNDDPGLSNLLVGQAKASEVIRHVLHPNLWVITAGTLPPNPAELVGGARFKAVLASLHQHFDWIVIDSPPVMAVTDAALIGHTAHAAVFVVEAETTKRQNARKAIEQLDRAKAKIVGVVLNRVDFKANPFYYSAYYRPEYSSYYASSAQIPKKSADDVLGTEVGIR